MLTHPTCSSALRFDPPRICHQAHSPTPHRQDLQQRLMPTQSTSGAACGAARGGGASGAASGGGATGGASGGTGRVGAGRGGGAGGGGASGGGP
ncbi:unnamed protein product [Closterium sp. NIES-64]|nr:unnamed protein product [Closterium sp. NIES-64]